MSGRTTCKYAVACASTENCSRCESYKSNDVCVICKRPYKGYGNNPYPVKEVGSCCDRCNMKYVIPARMRLCK